MPIEEEVTITQEQWQERHDRWLASREAVPAREPLMDAFSVRKRAEIIAWLSEVEAAGAKIAPVIGDWVLVAWRDWWYAVSLSQARKHQYLTSWAARRDIAAFYEVETRDWAAWCKAEYPSMAPVFEDRGIVPRDMARAHAKEMIRVYVDRGDSLEFLEQSPMGVADNPLHGGVGSLGPTGPCGSKRGKDSILITRVYGEDCCHEFSLRELYDELRTGVEQLSLFGGIS